MPGGIAREAVAALKDPLTWSAALLFTAVEILSLYPEASVQGSGAGLLGDDVSSELCSIVLYVAGFLAAAQVRPFLSRRWLCAVLAVAGGAGVALRLVPGAGLSVAAVVAGAMAMQLSFSGLMLMMLVCLSRLSLLRICRVVVGSGVLNSGLVALAEVAPTPLAVLFVVLGAAALAAGLGGAEGKDEHDIAHRAQRQLQFPVVLALGLVVVAASFSFLQSLLYQQSEDVVIAVVATTKLAAAVLFAAVLVWLSDTSYATLAKIIITLATAAFLVFLAQGSYSPVPSVLMATGYSLLELTSLLLLADLASYARWNPVRLFCAYYLIETAGYVGGALLLGQTLTVGPSAIRLAAAVLSLLLLVCAVWVFNDKRVNDFTWGVEPEIDAAPDGFAESKGAPEDASVSELAEAEVGTPTNGSSDSATAVAPVLSFSDKIALLAERYHLTERETEVLELFAAGRSAAFISELQFITINTVRSHIKHIYGKCDVHSRQELITLIEQQTPRDAAL